MDGVLVADIVIGKGLLVLELLTPEDQALSIFRAAVLVLDLLLHVLDGVRGLDDKRVSLASQLFRRNNEHLARIQYRLDEDAQHEMAVSLLRSMRCTLDLPA